MKKIIYFYKKFGGYFKMDDLKDFYFFKTLKEEQLIKLKEISKTVSFNKGSILFYEGDEPKSLIILVEGILQIYKIDQKGNKIVLHNFIPNTLIAEIANLEKINYPATAEFLTDGKVVLIDYSAFEKEFLKNEEVCFFLIKSLTQKIKFLEDVITNNIVMNSTARVAKFIYKHEDEFINFKKSQIAENLHIAPETLSRILKKFKTLKLLKSSKGGYQIIDREGLKLIFEC